MTEGSVFDVTVGGSASTSYISTARTEELVLNFASNTGLEVFNMSFPDLLVPATEDKLKRNLIKVSSLIDRSYRWLGTRTTEDQSMSWPRKEVPLWGIGYTAPPLLADDIIPLEIEIAVALLTISFQISDRTGDSPITELKSVSLDGVASVVWRDEASTASLSISSEAHDYLRKYGVLIPGLNSNIKTRTTGILSIPRGD